jgi:hypothetical protein
VSVDLDVDEVESAGNCAVVTVVDVVESLHPTPTIAIAVNITNWPNRFTRV